MTILIAGLIVFLGIHLVPALPALRARLSGKLGEGRYKGLFSALSGVGLLLIVVGYAYAPRGAQLFAPYAEARAVAPYAMIASFMLLAAANMKSHIRMTLVHPMLFGVGIWALVHLLANGHARATLLFGAFLAYAVLDVISATARGARKTFRPDAKFDLIALVSGTVLALLFMYCHRWIIGVQVVNWFN